MLETVSELCFQHDAAWKVRSSRIDTLAIFQFLVQCLGAQNSSYRKALCCLSFSDEEKQASAKSSICVARRKLGWVFFRKLLRALAEKLEVAYGRQYLWKGHPIFAVDGSKLNLPRDLKKLKYKSTHKGCYYPQAMLTVLYRLKMNIPYHFIFSRKTAEQRAVPFHLSEVPENSVVAYDRLYFSVGVVQAHIKHNVHGVFRLRRGGTWKEVKIFIASGKKDSLIHVKRRINGRDVDVNLRIVRYKAGGNDYYLATTLLDKKKYPIPCLKDLYHARWGVEEGFKFLKQELKLEVFHSRSPMGIKQEVAVGAILLLLSRVLALGRPRLRSKNKKKNTRPLAYSLGVASAALTRAVPYLINKTGIVRNTLAEEVTEITGLQTYTIQSGRSFPRISRKVISRWQKSIAQEWAKKKALERRALSP